MYALLGATTDIDDKLRAAREEIEKLKMLITQKTEGLNNRILAAVAQDLSKTGTYNQADAAKNGLFKLQPPAAFRLRRKLPGHFGKIYALHWASNSEDIVSASQDGKLLVWNTASTNKKVAIPLRTSWVMTCAYSPSRTFVASGGLDNLCSVFNIKDSVGWEVKQPHRELQQHEGYLSSCRFVDDNRILTASGDATCILWDIERQTPIRTFVGHSGDVESVAIWNPKSVFVSGAIDATAKIWDWRDGTGAEGTFKGHETDINSVAWFPDGNAFASGSDDSTIRLFDINAHQQLNCYQNQDIFSTVTSIDFTKSGYYLLSGYDEEPFCQAWNTMTGEKEPQLDQHPTHVSSLQTAPNGYSIATGCWDKILRIWA
eukprot:CAMPEP_0202685900 /NCGR_PEP_ID=MMETSP1385-20130828/1724_1 /ASSEMBLY_ACC=CAM_ASM_000861 /TAXON_ID=933848 /ORGANISM="Elphidium margaritaceum" /LENGTH=372 /DNA_ID=CAMNT_0049340373 /DNA_START=73 /DNA_END=1191 /DNA_ORIENTATION=-